MKIFLLALISVFTLSFTANASEATHNKAYCDSIGGETEVRHYYKPNKKQRRISVDCETATEVIEGGLDVRRSLDSVQQAVFFSILTGKKPVVVIYDRDGKEGRFEYRIRRVAETLGVEYRSVGVE